MKAEDGVAEYDLLSEEEYLDILDTLPKDNQYLEDNEDVYKRQDSGRIPRPDSLYD